MLAKAVPRSAVWRFAAGHFARSLDAVAVVLFALLSARYFIDATALAAQSPFWMDEVLSLWTARLPDMHVVWSALVHGAEFSPPLYDLFLHCLGKIGVTDALGVRLPSIVAIYCAAIAVGELVRRRAGIACAALAAGVVLSSGLFTYAVQARPYALVTAVFALAVLVHDCPGRPTNRRIAASGFLLAIAIGLHFYALLLAGTLALVEIVRARVERRTPCWRTLTAIAIAASSIALWWPMLAAASSYSGADVDASGYYGQPTLRALLGTYAMLLGWLWIPLIGLLVTVVAAGDRLAREPAVSDPALYAKALTIAAVPIGVIAFASLVSHSYADRYALVGGLGIALFFAALVARLGRGARPAAILLLAVLLIGTRWRDTGEIGKPDRTLALATVDAAPGMLPIATGSGLRFLEIRENVRPSIARRVVFLDTGGTSSGDPTNRHQVLRWKTIRPDLPVRGARAFLCATPAFLLLVDPQGGADDLPDWLATRVGTRFPVGRASLTLVRSRSCSNG